MKKSLNVITAWMMLSCAALLVSAGFEVETATEEDGRYLVTARRTDG